MTICILGRQPEIGLAELEALYGSENVRLVGDSCALVNAEVNFDRLGGSTKAARVVATLSTTSRNSIFKQISSVLPQLINKMPAEGKIKLGLSIYGYPINPYDLNGEALRLKKAIKKADRSVRVVPNENPALSSAQTFHNSLAGDLGLELIIIRDGEKTLVGHVTNVQNINSYRIRDRERPKRDTFVGMLPPKLAQTIINLATGPLMPPATVLDPFCGTGVILQEALLMGYDIYGTDLAERMVKFSAENLNWLREQDTWKAMTERLTTLDTLDATKGTWKFSPAPLAVACEGYLGQPLGGQNPTSEKLHEIVHDSNAVMRGFLKNIALQVPAGTRFCIAMPAWYVNDTTHHLPVIDELDGLGYEQVTFTSAPNGLLYRREDQVTGRELVVLTKR